MAAKGLEKLSLVVETNGGNMSLKEEQTMCDKSLKKEQTVYEDGFYEIEAILKKRIRHRSSQYLIKWLGYPKEENTWEPLEHLEKCSYWINEFEKSLKASKEKASRHRRWRRKPAATSVPARTNQPETHPPSPPCAEAPDERYIKLTTGYLIEDVDVARGSNVSTFIPRTDPGPIVKISRPISSKTEDGRILVIFTTKMANGSEGTSTNEFLKAHYPTLLMDFYQQNFISSYNRGM